MISCLPQLNDNLTNWRTLLWCYKQLDIRVRYLEKIVRPRVGWKQTKNKNSVMIFWKGVYFCLFKIWQLFSGMPANIIGAFTQALQGNPENRLRWCHLQKEKCLAVFDTIMKNSFRVLLYLNIAAGTGFKFFNAPIKALEGILGELRKFDNLPNCQNHISTCRKQEHDHSGQRGRW